MLMQDHQLRIESSDGSPATEYRVNNGSIQVRTLASGGANGVWRTVAPFKLRGHVERNTVVAQWLQHRLGWRRLLLACVAEEVEERAEEREDRSAESRSDTYHAA
jgi:hypothetical protein